MGAGTADKLEGADKPVAVGKLASEKEGHLEGRRREEQEEGSRVPARMVRGQGEEQPGQPVEAGRQGQEGQEEPGESGMGYPLPQQPPLSPGLAIVGAAPGLA